MFGTGGAADWSSLILARIAAGKEDGNNVDADNKIESDLSHEISEDQGLVDLSRQLNKVCSPLSHDEMDMDMPPRDGDCGRAVMVCVRPAGEDGGVFAALYEAEWLQGRRVQQNPETSCC